MPQHTAILRLFESQRSALVDYASGILGNRAQAEDLVQEAWLRFDAAAQRRFLEEPQSYLYRIVRNLALDGHRRLTRERRVFSGDDYYIATNRSADSHPSPESEALYKQEYEHAMDALAELPERTRIALEMHRFGGFKLREIARHLDISVPLAHKLVAAGVQHCKRRLGWP